MKKAIFIGAIIVLAGLLCGALEAIHPFGVPRNTPTDDYVLKYAMTEPVIPNLSAALIYDLRTLDTLIVIGAVFAGVCSVGALFRDGRRRE